jgi:hypothetical protein
LSGTAEIPLWAAPTPASTCDLVKFLALSWC